jgi:hypothetical protein
MISARRRAENEGGLSNFLGSVPVTSSSHGRSSVLGLRRPYAGSVFWATIVVDEVSKPPYSVELLLRLRSAALVLSKMGHHRDHCNGRPHDHRQCNWQQLLTLTMAVTLAVEASMA